jgi:uncharacterized protein YbjT (DUF2867 family)
MTILVTGSTGSIGSQVVAELAKKGADTRALARSPEKAKFPKGVTPVKGDLLDVDSMRAALANVRTLFLINAVAADEVTQALITLNLAREAGIERVVYFSVLNSDVFTNVPHFTGKYTVERMIEQFALPATILRPCYFTQNDLTLKEALLDHGVYPMPVGDVGVSMVDTGDIAEIAALELLRRENAAGPLPRETIELVGPDALTGTALAGIWAGILNKLVQYGGDDLEAIEQRVKAFSPSWAAYDIRLMLGRFQKDGMAATPAQVERMTKLLGRPPKSYRDFAAEAAKQWQD